MTSKNFQMRTKVLKVNDALGLVMGYAIICNENGEPYFDLQGDHVPEDAMLKAAADFMENSAVALDTHKGSTAGTVVFAFPLTDEIAKAFGLQVERTGLMIAMRPNAEMLKKFRNGELTGFSIGGLRVQDEEIE